MIRSGCPSRWQLPLRLYKYSSRRELEGHRRIAAEEAGPADSRRSGPPESDPVSRRAARAPLASAPPTGRLAGANCRWPDTTAGAPGQACHRGRFGVSLCSGGASGPPPVDRPNPQRRSRAPREALRARRNRARNWARPLRLGPALARWQCCQWAAPGARSLAPRRALRPSPPALRCASSRFRRACGVRRGR